MSNLTLLTRSRKNASSVPGTWLGNILDYIDGTLEPTAEGAIANGTVDFGTHSTSGSGYRRVTLDDGIYSVGDLGAIPVLGGSTGHADYGVQRNVDSSAIGAPSRTGYWLVIQASTHNNVTVDLGLTNSRLNFAGTSNTGNGHKILFVGINFIGGTLGSEGVTGAKNVFFWMCDSIYTPDQWLDNLYQSALAGGFTDELAETPIYKDPGRGTGGLYNYAYYFYNSTCIDVTGVQAITGGTISGDAVLTNRWLSSANSGAKFLSFMGKMGSKLCTPMRLAGAAGGASFNWGWYGVRMHGGDDGCYWGTSFYGNWRGCMFQVMGANHIGEFIYNPTRGEWVSIDPGTVFGSEADLIHNDGLQIGLNGRFPLLDRCTTNGRIIFNKQSNPAGPWEGKSWYLTSVPIPEHNGGGTDNSSILGDGTEMAGSHSFWPGGSTTPRDVEACILLGNANSMASDQSFRMTWVANIWRYCRPAAADRNAAQAETPGSQPNLSWYYFRLNGVRGNTSSTSYTDTLNALLQAEFIDYDLGLTTADEWMDWDTIEAALNAEGINEHKLWLDAYNAHGGGLDGWMDHPELCGGSIVNASIALPTA